LLLAALTLQISEWESRQQQEHPASQTPTNRPFVLPTAPSWAGPTGSESAQSDLPPLYTVASPQGPRPEARLADPRGSDTAQSHLPPSYTEVAPQGPRPEPTYLESLEPMGCLPDEDAIPTYQEVIEHPTQFHQSPTVV